MKVSSRAKIVKVNQQKEIFFVNVKIFVLPGFQPYVRPSFFIVRLVGLMIAVCISLVASSLVALTLPVWLGRSVMALWLVGAPPPAPQISTTDAQTEVRKIKFDISKTTLSNV